MGRPGAHNPFTFVDSYDGEGTSHEPVRHSESRDSVPLGPRIQKENFMLQFVFENAMVLAIVATLTTITVTLGYALLALSSRFAC